MGILQNARLHTTYLKTEGLSGPISNIEKEILFVHKNLHY